MKMEKYFCRTIKTITFEFFIVRVVFFGLFFLIATCQEATLKNESFPIEWIKKNSFDRSSAKSFEYFLKFEQNAKVDYSFYENWLKAKWHSRDICNPDDISATHRKEMKTLGYDDPCEFSTYFVDHFDSNNLFFFTIANKMNPAPAGFFTIKYHHFVYDKNQKKIIHADELTSSGFWESGSWDSKIEYVYTNKDETIFKIAETERELLAEIDNYVYDSISVKRKKLIFSKNHTIKELCDSVRYNMKSCRN